MATKKKTAELAPGYAVMRCGSKQYTVSTGDKLMIEKINAKPGDQITIEDVLLVSSPAAGKDASAEDSRKLAIGNPRVQGAAVRLKILGERKQKKIRVFKKKRRTGYTKRQGHRQTLTEVLVEGIEAP